MPRLPRRIDFLLGVIVLSFTLLFLARAQTSYEPTEFDAKLITFNRQWNKFFRAHFGCPADARYLRECKPESVPAVDLPEFRKTVDEWQKQFGEFEKK